MKSNTLNLHEFGLNSLFASEQIEINGGHDGIAYEIGHVVGKTVLIVGAIAAVIALF